MNEIISKSKEILVASSKDFILRSAFKFHLGSLWQKRSTAVVLFNEDYLMPLRVI